MSPRTNARTLQSNVSAIDRIKEILRAKYGKWFVNTVWGHIIYKPIRRARWKVPYGMKTLGEFLSWHNERLGLEQARTDHPLALEIYYSVTLKRTLTRDEVQAIIMELTYELIGEFFGTVAEYMEWGYDYEETTAQLPTNAMKRYSKDGEDFIEKDITRKFRTIEARLR
jgi:hypothetical protein